MGAMRVMGTMGILRLIILITPMAPITPISWHSYPLIEQLCFSPYTPAMVCFSGAPCRAMYLFTVATYAWIAASMMSVLAPAPL